jgi:tetratricopeptide (TPR) repeat protein
VTAYRNDRLALLVALLVAAVAVAVFANSLANGFAYDDDFIIKNRELVHGLEGIRTLLVSPYWPEGFSSGLYRPLTLLTYALDWWIWNGTPFGFHLVNVLLHAAVSALVVLFLLRLFPWWAAVAGGLVFAVHSVHTEAVANVVGRAELLAALFVLAACLIYMRGVRGGGISLGAGLAIVLLYALAGFAKEGGFVLPGLLLATDLPLLKDVKRDELKAWIRRRLPLFVALTGVLIVLLAARWLALGAPLENQPDRVFALDSSFVTRLFTMSRVWPRYFELLLLPFNLSADYSPGVILPASGITPLGIAGFALAVATIALAIALYRRAPEFAMAVAWMAIALLPVSNLIIMAEIVLAERTLYLPSVALSVLAALALVHIPAPRRRWVAVALTAWILVFSTVTIRRNSVWDSTDTVFEDLRRRHPESSRLLFGVASMIYRQGDWPKAEEWFDKSIRMWPYHAPYRVEYGMHLFEHGELEKADSLLAGAVRLKPNNVNYRVLLTLVRFQAGDAEGARRAIEGALEEMGERPELYAVLADLHLLAGRPDSAVIVQKLVLRLRQDGPTWRDWLRMAAMQHAAGDTAGARAALERAEAAPEAIAATVDSVRRAWRLLRAGSAGSAAGVESSSES